MELVEVIIARLISIYRRHRADTLYRCTTGELGVSEQANPRTIYGSKYYMQDDKTCNKTGNVIYHTSNNNSQDQ